MKNKKPNVILITIDSLRADHLGYMGYEKNISPNIDQLARESIVFKNAYSVGPVTPHSFPAILTSTYPLDYNGPKIDFPRVLISEVLKKNGYVTAAFHSNPYLSNYFGYNKGWDYFEDMVINHTILIKNKDIDKRNIIFLAKRFLINSFEKISLNLFPPIFFFFSYLKQRFFINYQKDVVLDLEQKRTARLINSVFEDFLRSCKSKPFFIWLHYMEVHQPYFPYDWYIKKRPLSYKEVIGNKLDRYSLFKFKSIFFKKFLKHYLPFLINLYDQGIKYLDRQIGEILNFLKQEKIDENTIIILTADHGDEFFEHGEGSHHPKLYNELLKVPLLIKVPDLNTKIINKKVSLLDLAPTICGLLNIQPPLSFKGNNLLGNNTSLVFHQTGYNKDAQFDPYTELQNSKQCKLAYQSERWKYIVDYINKKEELYDLLEDPHEKNNLINKKTGVYLKMKQIVENFKNKNLPSILKC